LREALRGEHETHAGSLAQLTAREREVLQGVARGRTNKEMAAELGISYRTVETHRESLMRKLQIRTVAELTRFALGAGILEG
jgi:FixJ family two-component response regulator